MTLLVLVGFTLYVLTMCRTVTFDANNKEPVLCGLLIGVLNARFAGGLGPV